MFLWNSDCTALVLQEDYCLEKFSVRPSSSEGSSVLECLPPDWGLNSWTFSRAGTEEAGWCLSSSEFLGSPHQDMSCFYLDRYRCAAGHQLMDRSSELILFTCYPSDFQRILMQKCFGEDREGYTFYNYENNCATTKWICVKIARAPRVHAWMLSPFSRVRLFLTLWTVAHQAHLSMGFPRQEYWHGWSCPPPGDLPDPGIELTPPELQGDSLSTEPPTKGHFWFLP